MKKMLSFITMVMFLVICSSCSGTKENVVTDTSYDINMWPKWSADICRNKTGYYIAGESFIYTMENGTIMALCNKADCTHNDKNCNAYLENIQKQTIWYDGNKLYVVAGEIRGAYYVYEIETDGSGSKKICELFQTAGIKSFGITCNYKDGYAYYILDLQTTSDITRGIYSQKLYRLKLEADAEPELLYENEDKSVSTSFGRCYFYEDDMYVVVNKRTASGNGSTSVLYRYSIKEDVMAPFLDKFVYYYFVTKNTLYYTTDDGIHQYILDKNEDALFYEDPAFSSAMYFDGTYIYLDDSWYQAAQEEHSDKVNIYILNLEGKLCKKLSLDWGSDILYGDGNSLVVKNVYNPKEGSPYATSKYSFYDKGQIENGGEEWTYIEMEIRTVE